MLANPAALHGAHEEVGRAVAGEQAAGAQPENQEAARGSQTPAPGVPSRPLGDKRIASRAPHAHSRRATRAALARDDLPADGSEGHLQC